MDIYAAPGALRPVLVTPGAVGVAVGRMLDDGLFQTDELATSLAAVLNTLTQIGWNQDTQATLLETLASDVRNGTLAQDHAVSSEAIRFIESNNTDDVFAVRECLLTDPPPQFTITRLLSQSGHEKLTFLAKSATHLEPVVLKRYRVSGETRDVEGEITARSHRNIVRTDYVQNSRGEPFFAEEYMDLILRDDEVLRGYVEPSNLLHGMLDALDYLHLSLHRIHGDIKPDNIAFSGDRYLLLDFGNSTPITEETRVPRSSFRTRAPELLQDIVNFQTPPTAADVWALGATLFNLLVGRFPLFERGEPTPDDEATRSIFRAELLRRAQTHYRSLVLEPLDAVAPALRPALHKMLCLDANDRASAGDIGRLVDHDLAPYLRSSSSAHHLSPEEELGVLERHVRVGLSHRTTPKGWSDRCRARLVELRDLPGWPESRLATLTDLIDAISVTSGARE